jgi:hypothetical protein
MAQGWTPQTPEAGVIVAVVIRETGLSFQTPQSQFLTTTHLIERIHV